jgi:hypothetical protein
LSAEAFVTRVLVGNTNALDIRTSMKTVTTRDGSFIPFSLLKMVTAAVYIILVKTLPFASDLL